MKNVYKIVLLKDYHGLKKGDVTTKYSRDNAGSLVQQGIAKFYKEKEEKKTNKK